MKKLLLTFLLAAYGLVTNAQTYPPKDTPQFEAPADSRYGWLNNALFVCAPEWTKEFQGIVLNVWKVK
jgi:hypothetical protein